MISNTSRKIALLQDQVLECFQQRPHLFVRPVGNVSVQHHALAEQRMLPRLRGVGLQQRGRSRSAPRRRRAASAAPFAIAPTAASGRGGRRGPDARNLRPGPCRSAGSSRPGSSVSMPQRFAYSATIARAERRSLGPTRRATARPWSRSFTHATVAARHRLIVRHRRVAQRPRPAARAHPVRRLALLPARARHLVVAAQPDHVLEAQLPQELEQRRSPRSRGPPAPSPYSRPPEPPPAAA